MCVLILVSLAVPWVSSGGDVLRGKYAEACGWAKSCGYVEAGEHVTWINIVLARRRESTKDQPPREFLEGSKKRKRRKRLYK